METIVIIYSSIELCGIPGNSDDFTIFGPKWRLVYDRHNIRSYVCTCTCVYILLHLVCFSDSPSSDILGESHRNAERSWIVTLRIESLLSLCSLCCNACQVSSLEWHFNIDCQLQLPLVHFLGAVYGFRLSGAIASNSFSVNKADIAAKPWEITDSYVGMPTSPWLLGISPSSSSPFTAGCLSLSCYSHLLVIGLRPCRLLLLLRLFSMWGGLVDVIFGQLGQLLLPQMILQFWFITLNPNIRSVSVYFMIWYGYPRLLLWSFHTVATKKSVRHPKHICWETMEVQGRKGRFLCICLANWQ